MSQRRYKRECLDCDESLSGQPSYKTRCRRCYSLHRNSLKMRTCEICGAREKREDWKKTCAACYRKARLAEKEEKAGPIQMVKNANDYEESLLDSFD